MVFIMYPEILNCQIQLNIHLKWTRCKKTHPDSLGVCYIEMWTNINNFIYFFFFAFCLCSSFENSNFKRVKFFWLSYLSGVGMLCFNRRLGCLENQSPISTTDLNTIFTSIAEARRIFKPFKYFRTPFYQRFEKAVLKLHRYGFKELILIIENK